MYIRRVHTEVVARHPMPRLQQCRQVAAFPPRPPPSTAHTATSRGAPGPAPPATATSSQAMAAPPPPSCVVVGITGPSCTGKTTLAARLAARLVGGHGMPRDDAPSPHQSPRCCVVHQDDHFVREEEAPRVRLRDGTECPDWDHPAAVRWDSLRLQLQVGPMT